MKPYRGALYCSLGILLFGIPSILAPYLAKDHSPWPAGISTLEEWVVLAELALLAPSAYLCSKASEKWANCLLLSCLPLGLKLVSMIPYSSWGQAKLLTLLLQVPLAVLPVLLLIEARNNYG